MLGSTPTLGARESDRSSFAHAVVTFRPRGGREDPADPHQIFERFVIGLSKHVDDVAAPMLEAPAEDEDSESESEAER